MANIDLILYIVATILFALGGFNVPASIKWESLAFAVLALSLAI